MSDVYFKFRVQLHTISKPGLKDHTEYLDLYARNAQEAGRIAIYRMADTHHDRCYDDWVVDRVYRTR